MAGCQSCADTYYVCRTHPDQPWGSGCCPPPAGAVCGDGVCVRGPGTVCPACTPPRPIVAADVTVRAVAPDVGGGRA